MKLLSTPLLIFVFLMLGFAIFKSTVPTRCSTILQNDTIFVLTGDSRRIPFAMRKLRQYPRANMYVIGAGGTAGYKSDRIIVESDSKSTYQNALAIKKISDKLGLNRIVLVTTVDHYNRARFLLRHELPDVEIVACPVPLSGMPVSKRLERWMTEYIKYVGTLIGIKES